MNKKPFEMTKDEYVQQSWNAPLNEVRRTADLETLGDLYRDEEAHKYFVKKALSEGKNIPAEVLADYPEFAPREVEKSC